MDPTTLVTFLFRAPPEAKTVELLGSWDNFQLPYRMHHDRLRGTQFYSGCFKFENIIFDGDDFQWTKPRSGGLKQGGSYWYYYRLNYDVDAYDERQPHATNCPLLPGQKINTLEVPIELIDPPPRSISAFGSYSDDIIGSLTRMSDQKTLDPADKFEALEPPPVSKVHSRCKSDEALDGRLEGLAATTGGNAISPISTPRSRPARSPRSASPCSRRSERIVRAGGLSSSSSIYSCDGSRSNSVSIVSAVSEMSLPLVSDREVVTLDAETGAQSASIEDLEVSGMAAAAALSSPREESVTLTAVGTGTVMAQMSGAIPVDAISERPLPSQDSAGPQSVQDLQFFESPSSTGLYQGLQHQTRMYTLPNVGISSTESLPRPPNSPASEDLDLFPCSSKERDENPTPMDENEHFDLVSPTFTASTVSSTGHNTPFRLSIQESADGHGMQLLPTIETEENVASRAGSQSGPQPQTERAWRERPSLFERSLARLRPPFSLNNYSLPSISSASNHSLAKTLSHPSARAPSQSPEPALPLPSIFTEDHGSMVEDIFSELGFLSSSINVN